jgi:hypothetical protein
MDREGSEEMEHAGTHHGRIMTSHTMEQKLIRIVWKFSFDGVDIHVYFHCVLVKIFQKSTKLGDGGT